jgi:hypothetical protein
MRSNYRLTVHLDNVKPIRTVTGKSKDSKGKMVEQTKSVCYNTISYYGKTKDDCKKRLMDIQADPSLTIRKGTNHQKMHKYGKELWYISFVN